MGHWLCQARCSQQSDIGDRMAETLWNGERRWAKPPPLGATECAPAPGRTPTPVDNPEQRTSRCDGRGSAQMVGDATSCAPLLACCQPCDGCTCGTVARFSHVRRPPRWRGSTWSTVRSTARLPQYRHSPRSRVKIVRRVSFGRDLGRLTKDSNRMTDGRG